MRFRGAISGLEFVRAPDDWTEAQLCTLDGWYRPNGKGQIERLVRTGAEGQPANPDRRWFVVLPARVRP